MDSLLTEDMTMDLGAWIDNIRFDIIQPVLVALVGLAWIYAEWLIVKGGLSRSGRIAEGRGGEGRIALREAFLEVFKDHGIGMLLTTALAAFFLVIIFQLDDFASILSDLLEAAKP